MKNNDSFLFGNLIGGALLKGGTSDGAKKGWETRRRGGASEAEPFADVGSSIDDAMEHLKAKSRQAAEMRRKGGSREAIISDRGVEKKCRKILERLDQAAKGAGVHDKWSVEDRRRDVEDALTFVTEVRGRKYRDEMEQ